MPSCMPCTCSILYILGRPSPKSALALLTLVLDACALVPTVVLCRTLGPVGVGVYAAGHHLLATHTGSACAAWLCDGVDLTTAARDVLAWGVVLGVSPASIVAVDEELRSASLPIHVSTTIDLSRKATIPEEVRSSITLIPLLQGCHRWRTGEKTCHIRTWRTDRRSDMSIRYLTGSCKNRITCPYSFLRFTPR
jgi:hypothetical protein